MSNLSLSAILPQTGVQVTYEQQKVVVIGDRIITKQEFRTWFEGLLDYSHSKEMVRLARLLSRHIQELETHQMNLSALRFRDKLQRIQNLFLKFTAYGSDSGGLGGNISLLTSFNFSEKHKSRATYMLKRESELPSRKNQRNGAVALINSQMALDDLMMNLDDVVKLNTLFQKHLQDFYIQLQQPMSAEDKQHLSTWAQYNMKKRFQAEHQSKKPISLAEYFWGRGHHHGYINEAYGTHLALVHPKALSVMNHREELLKSVIDEHGGKNSSSLYALLASTKGNVGSQISGDIVVIDENKNVVFNIQSKASQNASYIVKTSYTEFLRNITYFCHIYQNWNSLSEQQKTKDMDVLFEAFSTQAWTPIQRTLNECINDTTDGLCKVIG